MTQPAILVHSVAVFEVLKARGLAPVLLAGHSLGEWSALVAAGALTLEDAVVLVHRRGTFMQEAVAVGQGAMGAVIGLDGAAVAAACAEVADATGEAVSAANFNSPEQTVIAGTAGAVAKVVGAPEAEGRQARPAAPGLGPVPLRPDEAGGREALAVPRRGDRSRTSPSRS